MRPSTFRPQTVLTGAGFALPDQEKLATVYGNMSKAPKGASTARLLPTCPIVSAKTASGERRKMQLVIPAAIAGSRLLVIPAAIAGSRLLVNNEINRQLNAQRLTLVCVLDYCDED